MLDRFLDVEHAGGFSEESQKIDVDHSQEYDEADNETGQPHAYTAVPRKAFECP